MKKNLLMIRCANGETIEKLINHINNKYKNEEINFYCLIQKSSIENFKQKYPYIEYIEKEDGFFSYNFFKKNKQLKNKLENMHFDEIYIPSSYVDYPDFNEVFLISSRIKNKKIILFNCYGEILEKKLNFVLLWVDRYLGEVIYFIKVLFALIGISIIYAFIYPYYFVKRKLFKNI